ncbi:class I SAM-dependent methyltransferase [Paenibacillus spongiae]|uniref:Methyltransferase domain-containing protein n=1 Tax=Paenibacillus spongiae TaxID=2909671 RepID=A0ABY5SFM5_9BACL|nr:class I SAM-dependent methyltransferase [Paenibacillus spongiae]UVI31473.1 methyltransferase domain-containing protein [Paenibacillus spongiae]
MGFLSVISMAHKLVAERVTAGDIVIDATCGNGVDTQFLAELVGPRGTVYGFDVQEQALLRTRERLNPLEAAGRLPRMNLLLDSHASMKEHIAEAEHGNIAAAMFNFGYLPGADPRVITQVESSLAALRAAVPALRSGGILTAVLYPGHEGGGSEASAVEAWAAALAPAEGQTLLYRMAQKPSAPYLIAIEKRSAMR